MHYHQRRMLCFCAAGPRQRQDGRTANAAHYSCATTATASASGAVRPCRRARAAARAQTPTACSTTTRRRSSRESRKRRRDRRSWPHQFETYAPLGARRGAVIREVTETFARKREETPPGVDGRRRLRDSSDARSPEGGRLHLPHGLACDDQPIWMRTRSGRSCLCPTRSRSRLPMIVHRKHSAREFCDMVVDQSTRCSSNA